MKESYFLPYVITVSFYKLQDKQKQGTNCIMYPINIHIEEPKKLLPKL